MTLEELKIEAKNQGYKLIKDTPYEKFLPCGDCDNCEHLDGDCCRLIYEEKVKEYKNDR